MQDEHYDFDWTLCFKERMNCPMDQKSSFQETISIPGIEDTYLLMQILLWTTNKMLPTISLISPLNLVRKNSKSVLARLQLIPCWHIGYFAICLQSLQATSTRRTGKELKVHVAQSHTSKTHIFISIKCLKDCNSVLFLL